jgi:hypothetical protein
MLLSLKEKNIMYSTDPDDEDSLIGGDALSNENNESIESLPKESLINDSPFTDDADEEVGENTVPIPPPSD